MNDDNNVLVDDQTDLLERIEYLEEVNQALVCEILSCVETLSRLSLPTPSDREIVSEKTQQLNQFTNWLRDIMIREHLRFNRQDDATVIIEHYAGEMDNEAIGVQLNLQDTVSSDEEESTDSEAEAEAEVPVREVTTVMLIDNMPLGNGDTNRLCAICHCNFEVETMTRTLKQCGHMFCDACILKWVFNTRSACRTCPECRAEIA